MNRILHNVELRHQNVLKPHPLKWRRSELAHLIQERSGMTERARTSLRIRGIEWHIFKEHSATLLRVGVALRKWQVCAETSKIPDGLRTEETISHLKLR